MDDAEYELEKMLRNIAEHLVSRGMSGILHRRYRRRGRKYGGQRIISDDSVADSKNPFCSFMTDLDYLFRINDDNYTDDINCYPGTHVMTYDIPDISIPYNEKPVRYNTKINGIPAILLAIDKVIGNLAGKYKLTMTKDEPVKSNDVTTTDSGGKIETHSYRSHYTLSDGTHTYQTDVSYVEKVYTPGPFDVFRGAPESRDIQRSKRCIHQPEQIVFEEIRISYTIPAGPEKPKKALPVIEI